MCITAPESSRLLRAECRRTVPDGSRSRLRALHRQGVRPSHWPTWPDERADPQEPRAALPLRFCQVSGSWTLDIVPVT